MNGDLGWQMSIWEAAARLGAALACAAVVGWERQAHGRVAGIRTHMLVALGAAGFTLAGLAFVAADRRAGGQAGDAVRIIGAVATGVGFLGAGAIMKSGEHVTGLTTAASIWVVASAGIAAGAGYYALALLLSLATLLTLRALIGIERFAERRAREKKG